ncbi:MAG TPA: nuclear transport factor 2 family protein, partial [Thermoanaerobaculia bacterium]
CTEAEEYFPSLTRDGTIYFTLEGDAARPDGIYRSRLKDGAYTAPERLPDHVNSGRARYNAFIAPDESYLVYAIHGRPDGLGRSDYYISFRSPDDTWSEPVNLGPKINSAADDEYSPYVTRDGRYLFFMSSRTAPAAELFGDRVTADRLQRLAISPGNGNADIWWVDASFLQELRPEGRSAQPAPARVAPPDAQAVEQIVRDAIGWALTKDRARLESIMAHDGDFFIFHPDSKSTVRGWDAFAKMIPTFMNPRFVATRFEVKDLATVFARSGDVAWYSALLEDCGAWDGKESSWKATRWTGVLEKRRGTWVIVQMHFSFAKD